MLCTIKEINIHAGAEILGIQSKDASKNEMLLEKQIKTIHLATRPEVLCIGEEFCVTGSNDGKMEAFFLQEMNVSNGPDLPFCKWQYCTAPADVCLSSSCCAAIVDKKLHITIIKYVCNKYSQLKVCERDHTTIPISYVVSSVPDNHLFAQRDIPSRDIADTTRTQIMNVSCISIGGSILYFVTEGRFVLIYDIEVFL